MSRLLATASRVSARTSRLSAASVTASPATPFGGFSNLTSAAHYPQEVAGMVLIDSTQPATEPHPGTGQRMCPSMTLVLTRSRAMSPA